MGWLFTQGQTRRELIERLTEPFTGASGNDYTCLAHCTRGNNLWSVWERSGQDDESRRYIVLFMMQRQAGYGWGYKDVSEEMGPGYHNCPLAYLDMANDGVNHDWRERVRQYHARTNTSRLNIGDKVALVGSTVEWAKIVSTRPLRGIGNDGRLYTIPKRILGNILSE